MCKIHACANYTYMLCVQNTPVCKLHLHALYTEYTCVQITSSHNVCKLHATVCKLLSPNYDLSSFTRMTRSVLDTIYVKICHRSDGVNGSCAVCILPNIFSRFNFSRIVFSPSNISSNTFSQKRLSGWSFSRFFFF